MSAERLLLLLRLLSRWQTRKELANACGCSQREITRDLSDLANLGFLFEMRVSSHARRHWRIVAVRKTLSRLIREA